MADFSDALVSEIPSGILSEQLVVDSITQTLENNVPSLRRLKILIHGQEVETLAGHVDLTGFFDLNPPQPAQIRDRRNAASACWPRRPHCGDSSCAAPASACSCANCALNRLTPPAPSHSSLSPFHLLDRTC